VLQHFELRNTTLQHYRLCMYLLLKTVVFNVLFDNRHIDSTGDITCIIIQTL